jgi:hypothetical protein
MRLGPLPRPAKAAAAKFWVTIMSKKIMIIRHGEKPDKDESIRGVSVEGKHEKDELSTRGWQRAGALVRFFNPLNGSFSHSGLARPDVIFAAAPSGHVTSLRSEHTVLAVAQSLGKQINTRHSKGDEKELLKDVFAADGVVLIAWEHNAIVDLATMVLGKKAPKWPDSRFDLVWIFDQKPHETGWTFTQIPQMVLPGDSAYPV